MSLPLDIFIGSSNCFPMCGDLLLCGPDITILVFEIFSERIEILADLFNKGL